MSIVQQVNVCHHLHLRNNKKYPHKRERCLAIHGLLYLIIQSIELKTYTISFSKQDAFGTTITV